MFQPMLASPIELNNVKYPVYCSPKYDGIRCVIRDGVALSRKLKQIPNVYISKMLSMCEDNLDGELIIPHANFNQIQSAVMSEDGEPEFEFHIFDVISTKPYLERVEALKSMKLPKFCKKVLPHKFDNEEDMLEYERECVEDYEFEGIMIRSPNGPYKFGRSTAKQGYLLKLKRFTDAEATIVGFEEMMHNENEKTKDELGHAKRSHKKAGMVAAGVLGSFIVEMNDGKQFKVSTGMTAEDRANYWENRESMLGQLVKYKFQEAGAKNLPRFPVFLGIRHPDDT
jgi:DNA ligase 1